MAKRVRSEKTRRASRRGNGSGGEPEPLPGASDRTRKLLHDTRRLIGEIDQRLSTR